MATGTDHMAMNTVIHSALRRDLARLDAVLAESLPPDRRAAVCAFVPWLVRTVHHHHVGEDEGMWPRVVAKRPEAAELAAVNGAEHDAMVVASDRLVAAAAAYDTDGSDASREALRTAVSEMAGVTLPHLEHEERESVPVVVATLDDADWKYLEKNYYRKGMSMKDMGTSLMWMADDADPAGAAALHSQVPGPVMWFLGVTSGRGYDRQAALRWGSMAGRRA